MSAVPKLKQSRTAALDQAIKLHRELTAPGVQGDLGEKLSAVAYLREAAKAAHTTTPRLREIADALAALPECERQHVDQLRGGCRKQIRATKVSAGAMLDPPQTRSACETWAPLTDVEAELAALPLKPVPTVLELVALEVLEAAEQEPEVFGVVEVPLAQHATDAAKKHARLAELCSEVRDTWPVSELAFNPAARTESGDVLYRVSYRLSGVDSDIAWDSPAQLVAKLAAG